MPSGRMLSTNIEFWFSCPCKRCSDRVFGQTLRWFCQPWLKRLSSWPFSRYSKHTFLLVWRSLYIVSEALSPSLMVGRLFGSSWCLYVVVGPSSPYGWLLEIVGGNAAVRDRKRCVDPHLSRAPPLDRRDSLFIREK